MIFTFKNKTTTCLYTKFKSKKFRRLHFLFIFCYFCSHYEISIYINNMSNLKLFEDKQVRATWSETEEKWYFSVQDIVKILTDSSDVKQYIKRMLGRDEQLKLN